MDNNSSNHYWSFMATNPNDHTDPNSNYNYLIQNPNFPPPSPINNTNFLLSRNLSGGMNMMEDYELQRRLQYPSIETLMNRLRLAKSAIGDSYFVPSMNMGLNYPNQNFVNRSQMDEMDAVYLQLQRLNQSRYYKPRINNNNIHGLNNNHRGVHSRVQFDHDHSDQVVRPQQQQQLFSYASLGEFRGMVNTLAKDQQGHRLLLRKVEERKEEDIGMIVSEIKHDLHTLMVNQFATHLIQKLVEACSEDQITDLVLALVSDETKLWDVCVHSQGTRAVQKLMERTTIDHQKNLFVSSLKGMTIALSKNLHGHHIIQHCLLHFSADETKPLFDEIVQNCPHLATDKSGCCVLQDCLALAKGEMLERLIVDITTNAFLLSVHAYGNYVVQYLLKRKIHPVTTAILEQLGGNYVSLSMDKYGSNVVQKCLEESTEEQSSKIIRELTQNHDIFLKVVQDGYGNYVVQSALQVSKGGVREALFSLIQIHYPLLSCHPYGKKVLGKARESKYHLQQACRLWR